MALSAAVDWDVRSGGSANNGGGFNRTAGGTDRSQSNAGYVEIDQTANVGTIQATTTNFKFTLGYNGSVSSADVGNIVYFSGSGAGGLGTVGHYEITSVSGTDTWIFDRSLGTSGGAPTGVMGGAKAAPADLITTTTPVVAGNIIYCKGAQTISASTITAPAIANVKVIGYSTTRGDNVKPTWTVGANSTTIIQQASTSAVGWLYECFTFDGAKGTYTTTRGYNGSNGVVAFVNCTFQNFNNNCVTTTIQNRFTNCDFIDCNTQTVFNGNTGGSAIVGCRFSGNSTVNFSLGNGGRAQLVDCEFYDGSGASSDYVQISNVAAYVDCYNCTFKGSGRHGINYQGNAAASMVVNCLFSENTSYGISTSATNPAATIINCAFYVGGGTGATTGLDSARVTGTVTLTGDPFVDSSTDNYQLNNTSGAGASCRNTGYPTTLGGQNAYKNIGAFDIANSSAGGLLSHRGMTGGLTG